MSYHIKTTWNNQTIKYHEQIKIDLSWKPNNDFIKVEIEAPFFNDKAPSIQPKNIIPKLWNYEGKINIFFYITYSLYFLEIYIGIFLRADTSF